MPAIPRPPNCSRRSSGPASAIASWPAWPTAADLRATRLALGLRPGYAMVDTCAAEFAAETPYFYSTYAAAGSLPEAPPVERQAALVIGSGPVRIGQGIEFDYCAVQAAGGAPPGGLASGDDQLEPRDGLDRLRRQLAPLLRAARPRERPQRHRRRDGRGPATPAGGRRLWRPDATEPRRPARSGRRSAAGIGPRGDRPGRGAGPFLGAAGPARHSATRGRDGPQRRGSADARRADRLPGDRAALVRHRRAGDRLLLLARPTSPASWPRPRSSIPTGRSGSTGTSRASRWTSTPCRTAATS